MTFSAPKGVSLQALVHGDRRIVEAHERAVAAAVREAEHLAMARSTNNKNQRRTYGKTGGSEVSPRNLPCARS
ncbi:relaxase domain-containing protein (plasmid) [Xanthomonas hortorum pv. pelargonii]|nr:relaxase domain-containing protein [Xanthomonas hortorum pv. pelargonii]